MNSSTPAAATSPSRDLGGGPTSAATASSASQRWIATSTARRRIHHATRRSSELAKVHVCDWGSADPRTSSVRSRLASYQEGKSATSSGAGSRARRLTRSLDVTTAAIHTRISPVWRMRPAAFHSGQCDTGLSQPVWAAARSARASAADLSSSAPVSIQESLACDQLHSLSAAAGRLQRTRDVCRAVYAFLSRSTILDRRRPAHDSRARDAGIIVRRSWSGVCLVALEHLGPVSYTHLT